MPIGAKLTLAFLLILLVAFALGLYSLTTTQEELRKAVGQGSVFLAQDISERIDKDIFLKIEEIELYSKDVFLQRALVESNQTFEQLASASAAEEYIAQRESEWVSAPEDVITPFMRELIDNEVSDALREEFIGFWERKYGVRVYGEAFVTNRYGANIAQTGKTSDYYQADEEWWRVAKERGFSIGDIEYDESAKLWTMPLSVRIEDAQGNFLGAIKTVPFITELVGGIALTAKKYETTEIKLATEDGQLIYSTKAFQIFEDVSGEEFFKNIGPESGFFLAEGSGGREKLFAYTHSRGSRNFEGLGWILVIGHDTAEVFAPVQDLRNALAVMSSILLLLIGLLAITLTRAISNPIKTLTKGAERISRGNLGVKIDIKSKDELGQLATSFNRMAAQVQSLYANLEAKVAERTKELIQLNKELDETGKVLVRRDMELTQSNERLRDLDAIKSQFVSVAAHQLRTPLTGIKWTLYALLEEQIGKLNQEQEKFAGDAYKATQRLIDLVNDLLDISRLEEGRFGFKMKRQAIEPLVKKSYESLEKFATNKGIKFSLELPKGKVPLLDFDEEKIGIVLENLIDNAIKYTAPAGSVTVRVIKEEKRVSVEVADTGIGVPKEQASRVFTKFFRGENAQLYQTSGTGLGLYLAKNIISNHKGTMFFTTEEGKGSTFSFSIPMPTAKKTSKEKRSKKL